MSRRFFLFLSLLFTLLYSCSRNVAVVYDEEIVFARDSEVTISDLVNSVSVKTVSLPEGFILSRIDKAIVRDSLLYLFDYGRKRVCSADMSTGKTLFTLDRFGRGPGEYLDVKSAAIRTRIDYCNI